MPPANQIQPLPHAVRTANIVHTSTSGSSRKRPVSALEAETAVGFAIASSRADHMKAQSLLQQCYSWRGYRASHLIGVAGGTTLLALADEEAIGTMSIRIDHEAGVLCEAQYPLEIAALRRSGARLCELGQLAVARHSPPLDVIAPLFHLAHLLGHEAAACSDYVIEVHPRHAGFYARAFAFERIGEERICERVGAPAVLMRLSADHATQQIDSLGGTRSGKHSAFAYCFAAHEAEAWRQAIARRRRAAHLA